MGHTVYVCVSCINLSMMSNLLLHCLQISGHNAAEDSPSLVCYNYVARILAFETLYV